MKYVLTIGFEASRKLTEEELGQIQIDAIAQIEEPVTADGEDADFTTQLYGSDIDWVTEFN